MLIDLNSQNGTWMECAARGPRRAAAGRAGRRSARTGWSSTTRRIEVKEHELEQPRTIGRYEVHRARGPRRHGRALPRPRPGARSRGRDQGDGAATSPPTNRARPRFYREARAVRPAPAPQHRHDLRVRRGQRQRRTSRWSSCAGRASRQRMTSGPPLTLVQKLDIVAQLLHGPPLRARAGHRPPRRQAGQHLAARRRHGEAARLRHRQDRGLDDDERGQRARQRLLHGARAGRRPRGRRPRRHVLPPASSCTSCSPRTGRSRASRRPP